MAEESPRGQGELGVAIAQMQNDLTDTEEALVQDKDFLADLEKNCATKEKEWAIICKTRSEELLALADTIKMLNDDDALELFKKTLPSASASSLARPSWKGGAVLFAAAGYLSANGTLTKNVSEANMETAKSVEKAAATVGKQSAKLWNFAVGKLNKQ